MNRRLTAPLPDAAPRPAASARRAVVALGANLGDRAETILEAIADLGRLPLTDLVAAATPIESIAITLGGPDSDAPKYLNTVALIDTRLAPTLLLGYLHAIESRHGRVRRERWGSRTLDLDLIAYGDVRSRGPALVLPHPRAAERDFVLDPWFALDPDAVLPGVGRVADLRDRLRQGGAG